MGERTVGERTDAGQHEKKWGTNVGLVPAWRWGSQPPVSITSRLTIDWQSGLLVGCSLTTTGRDSSLTLTWPAFDWISKRMNYKSAWMDCWTKGREHWVHEFPLVDTGLNELTDTWIGLVPSLTWFLWIDCSLVTSFNWSSRLNWTRELTDWSWNDWLLLCRMNELNH